jgi:hypothetical protein
MIHLAPKASTGQLFGKGSLFCEEEEEEEEEEEIGIRHLYAHVSLC